MCNLAKTLRGAILLLSVVQISVGQDPAFCNVVNNLKASVPSQRRALISFWLTRGPDQEFGGFHGTLDRSGAPVTYGSYTNKGLVQQARHLWTLSAYFHMFGQEEGADPGRLRQLADSQYAFLMSWMLDDATSLFIWQVRRDGQAEGREMSLYGNFFAVYALAKYAEAFGNQEAAAQALRTQTAIDAAWLDTTHGGYDQSTSSPVLDRDSGGSPVPKGFNAQLHGVEALTQLYKTTRVAEVRDRLLSLVKVVSDKVFQRQFTGSSPNTTGAIYALRYFDRTWVPLLGKGQSELSVDHGHAMEYFWLLVETMEVLGAEAPAQLRDQVLQVAGSAADYSAQMGHVAGSGYCEDSTVGRGCGTDERWWWVQDEAVLALWQLYRFQAKPDHLARLEDTYRWLINVQTDATYGEQFPGVRGGGSWDGGDITSRLVEFEGLVGAKGSFWKASYHSGRAFMNLDLWLRGVSC